MILKKIFSPIVWINLTCMILFVILVIFGMWYATMKYTLHGEIITVPDITGIHHTAARDTLAQHGLIIHISDSGFNRNLRPGTVLMQYPEAGTEVKRDRKVYLTINSSSGPTLTIPDIADNCDVYEAEIRLRTMGFKLGPKEYAKGDKDWVIGVKCQGRTVMAGDKIPAEAPVVLVVGNNLTEDEQWERENQNSDAYSFEEETEW
jgi:beta-lactam-binding protein with PASTA domain